MTVSEHIICSLEYRGATKQWLAEKLGITKQTMNYKLTHNSFTAEELLKIAKVMDIDLNMWLQAMKVRFQRQNKTNIMNGGIIKWQTK